MLKSNNNNFAKKIICISLSLVIVFMLSIDTNNTLAKSKNSSSYTDAVVIHLDKTDSIIGKYIVLVKNIDTGKVIGNAYIDTASSNRFIDIPGEIKTKNGQTLLACAMLSDTKEVACDTHT